MHELTGGKIGMRNTWHGDYHVSRWIKKGVLHLYQKESVGEGRKRKRKDRKKKKEEGKKKAEEGRSSIYWSPVFEQARGSTS